jgi:hypothetical protein
MDALLGVNLAAHEFLAKGKFKLIAVTEGNAFERPL